MEISLPLLHHGQPCTFFSRTRKMHLRCKYKYKYKYTCDTGQTRNKMR